MSWNVGHVAMHVLGRQTLSYLTPHFLTSSFHLFDRKMYERIVNARRQRVCLLEAHQKLQDNECDNTISSHANSSFIRSDLQEDSSNNSFTADESDESSMFYLASSSSTCSSQSPLFPSYAIIKIVSSECYQEEQKVLVPEEGENEEYFIFEMDL